MSKWQQSSFPPRIIITVQGFLYFVLSQLYTNVQIYHDNPLHPLCIKADFGLATWEKYWSILGPLNKNTYCQVARDSFQVYSREFRSSYTPFNVFVRRSAVQRFWRINMDGCQRDLCITEIKCVEFHENIFEIHMYPFIYTWWSEFKAILSNRCWITFQLCISKQLFGRGCLS